MINNIIRDKGDIKWQYQREKLQNLEEIREELTIKQLCLL